MKANELAYGDWVMVEGIARKVSQLTRHKIGYFRPEISWGDCKLSYTRLHDVYPIPLTAEILERNGFVRSGKFMSIWWNDSDVVYADSSFDYHIDISICGNDNHSEYVNVRIPHKGIGIPLYFVHELQHALRLCGLTELADNFKIE